MPDDTPEQIIESLYTVIYVSLPYEGYDLDNEQLRQDHALAVQLLLRFVKSPRVLKHFRPSEQELGRLQLSKLIKGKDEAAQAAGIALASFLMRNCSSVLPIELLGNDEQAFAIV